MPSTVALVLIITAFIAGGSTVLIWNSHRKLKERVAELEKTSNARHLPYKTADGIENATAVILKIMREREKEKQEVDFELDFLKNALGHLKNARNNK